MPPYDRLISETEENINNRPHCCSTELDLSRPLDRRPTTYTEPEYVEDKDTFVDIQVAEVKQRHENLQLVLIVERLGDLELMLQFMERCGGVFGLLEWANTTESNIKRIRPTSREVEPLEQEKEKFEVQLGG
ncbi:uncharacterized protein [Apostichopus japonicus]|uniref:uncharacterized protein n=1 Tax=Stichopus japonicus TaxID=307972 RepID=UPI003AB7C97F